MNKEKIKEIIKEERAILFMKTIKIIGLIIVLSLALFGLWCIIWDYYDEGYSEGYQTGWSDKHNEIIEMAKNTGAVSFQETKYSMTQITLYAEQCPVKCYVNDIKPKEIQT